MADLGNIGASDGTGEAVQAIVTAIRTAGSSSITVNSVTHWPASFIATSGTLLANNTLNPSTIFVFSGHLSSGKIVIDSAAPGYTDPGNAVNDVILVKPTTLFADTLQSKLQVVHNNDGSLKSGIVTTANVADGAVTSGKLAIGAIGQIFQSRTSNVTQGSTTTPSSYNGFNGTYTLNAVNGHHYEFTFNEPNVSEQNPANENFNINVLINGTVIGEYSRLFRSSSAGSDMVAGSVFWTASSTASFNVTLQFFNDNTSAGTWTAAATAIAPAFFVVKDIT